MDISNGHQLAKQDQPGGRACGELYAWFLMAVWMLHMDCKYVFMEYRRDAVDSACGEWIDAAKQGKGCGGYPSKWMRIGLWILDSGFKARGQRSEPCGENPR